MGVPKGLILEKRKSPKKSSGLWKKSEKVVWTLENVRKSRLDVGKSLKKSTGLRKKSEKIVWTSEKVRKSPKKSSGLWKNEKVWKSPTLEKGKSPKKSDFGKRKKSQKV